MTDIRLQGLAKERKTVVPVVDRCNGLTMSHNFRVGSIVKFKNQQRVVQHVNFYYIGQHTVQMPGSRVAYTLDLGSPYTKVPFDQVELIKI